jgi:NAD+ diphosphatase
MGHLVAAAEAAAGVSGAPVRPQDARAFQACATGEMPFAAPPEYLPAVTAPGAPAADALWYLFRESRVLVGDGTMQLPVTNQALALVPTQQHFLGTLRGQEIYAAETDRSAPDGYRYSDLRSLFLRLDDAHYALAGRGLQIVDWDRTHRFCGRCGTPTQARSCERSRECPACGLIAYPRLAPAVMALVKRPPGEILLARSHRFPPGMYSALAGFVEPGETLEQCLAREVEEEVGVRIANVRYFASQPWPFPHSLMIAFVADWAGGEIRVDPTEIEDAKWCNLSGLPQLPQSISIARRLIDWTIANMEGAMDDEGKA